MYLGLYIYMIIYIRLFLGIWDGYKAASLAFLSANYILIMFGQLFERPQSQVR